MLEESAEGGVTCRGIELSDAMVSAVTPNLFGATDRGVL